jgi:phosphohistidine phosphatase
MKIYLIRHGDAEHGSLSKSDFERELTPSGIEKLKYAAAGWKQFIKPFDFIATSPLKRAIQTTNIIAEAYGLSDKIIIENRLACGSRTEDIINIANSIDADRIAFVGHEPDLSAHIANLVSGGNANFEFRKGMIARIEFGGKVRFSRGVLQFLIPCEVFLK